MAIQTPPGWYPDPWSPRLIRYWDGNTWTQSTAPAPAGAAPPFSYTGELVSPGLPWWQTWFAIVPGLLFCLPLGLIGLWRRPDTTNQTKTIVSLAAALLIGVALLLPDDTTKPRETPDAVAPATSKPTPTPSTESQTAQETPLVDPTPTVTEPTTAAVPSLRGLTMAEAEQQLQAVGLRLGQVQHKMSAKKAGSVLKQATAGGTALPLGAEVALVVADPFPLVPSVLGASESSAVGTLESAGFTVRTTTQTRTSGPAGVVLSQTPTDTARLRPGGIVTITISKVVPTLVGGSGGNCTPGYSPCLPPASDYDCAGGSGDGPKYAQGPIRVSGSDPYDLDRENDGVACE